MNRTQLRVVEALADGAIFCLPTAGLEPETTNCITESVKGTAHRPKRTIHTSSRFARVRYGDTVEFVCTD